MPRLTQPLGHERGDLRIILDDQEPHGADAPVTEGRA
jgi:hypothetical protein